MIFLHDLLNTVVSEYQACGSRITCTPVPDNTDRDWIVLVKEGEWDTFCCTLFDSNWIQGGSSIPNECNTLSPDARFNSFTLDIDNIIATASPEFYRRFVSATHVAKRLNLLNKDDRIAVFQAVLYGTYYP